MSSLDEHFPDPSNDEQMSGSQQGDGLSPNQYPLPETNS